VSEIDTIVGIQTKVEDLLGQLTGYGNRRNNLLGKTEKNNTSRSASVLELDI